MPAIFPIFAIVAVFVFISAHAATHPPRRRRYDSRSRYDSDYGGSRSGGSRGSDYGDRRSSRSGGGRDSRYSSSRSGRGRDDRSYSDRGRY